MLALLRSHIHGDEDQFLSIAMEIAALEAKKGHFRLANNVKILIDAARERGGIPALRGAPVLQMQPKGELSAILSVRYPEERLSSMVLPEDTFLRLKRVLLEQKQQQRIRSHGLHPRRKILLVGPPGSGKTFTAAALAGELELPLFTIVLEALITKFLGETAAKLKLIFDSMLSMRGVYFFDEFDAIGARRNSSNDVGEIRRVLNSFLQFLEKDASLGLIVAATNHPELLDTALFRRFDDVIQYSLPNEKVAKEIFKTKLVSFETGDVNWEETVEQALNLSQAEISRAAEEAAKAAVLQNSRKVTSEMLSNAIEERKMSVTRQS